MNRLEINRIRAGMTQTELAEKSGVLQVEISRAETGAKDLKGQAWGALAKALGCSVDEILGIRN